MVEPDSAIETLEALLGMKLLAHQEHAVRGVAQQAGPVRACFHFPTGKGKTVTMLGAAYVLGYSEALVVAPPATAQSWQRTAKSLGIAVQVVSHNKFRMADFKVSRDVPVLMDEFHLLGRHTSKGWKKLSGIEKGLRAPVILASATPNYNDIERVYCVHKILDRAATKGPYLSYLLRHCETEFDPFSATPKVVRFWNFASAEEFLSALPNVYYVPDELVYEIIDLPVPLELSEEFLQFRMDEQRGRIMASGMEVRHSTSRHWLLTKERYPKEAVLQTLGTILPDVGDVTRKALVFFAHSSIAVRYFDVLSKRYPCYYIDGSTSLREKELTLAAFLKTKTRAVLIGTSSIATGTDGIDKVADTLIIVDDIDGDDAKRRQLIGRIMPRGTDTDASNKRVYRCVPE